MNNKPWIVEVYTQTKDFLGVSSFKTLQEASEYANRLRDRNNYIANVYETDEQLGDL